MSSTQHPMPCAETRPRYLLEVLPTGCTQPKTSRPSSNHQVESRERQNEHTSPSCRRPVLLHLLRAKCHRDNSASLDSSLHSARAATNPSHPPSPCRSPKKRDRPPIREPGSTFRPFTMPAALKFTEHHYATDNELQKLGVWEFPSTADNAAGYWVM